MRAEAGAEAEAKVGERGVGAGEEADTAASEVVAAAGAAWSCLTPRAGWCPSTLGAAAVGCLPTLERRRAAAVGSSPT